MPSLYVFAQRDSWFRLLPIAAICRSKAGSQALRERCASNARRMNTDNEHPKAAVWASQPCRSAAVHRISMRPVRSFVRRRAATVFLPFRGSKGRSPSPAPAERTVALANVRTRGRLACMKMAEQQRES